MGGRADGRAGGPRGRAGGEAGALKISRRAHDEAVWNYKSHVTNVK